MSSIYTITIVATRGDNDLDDQTNLTIYDHASFEEEVGEFLIDSGATNWRVLRVGNHVPEEAGEFIAHFITDGILDTKFWEWQEVMERSTKNEEVWEAAYQLGIPPEKVEEAYEGRYDSDAEYARQYAESTGCLGQVAWPYTHISWSDAAKDLDICEENHQYFNNNW